MFDITSLTKVTNVTGDIVFLEVFGQRIVVANSAKAASDILEKRSALYSDRLCLPVFRDPTLWVYDSAMPWGRIQLIPRLRPSLRLDMSHSTVLLGYNDTWRHHRQMLNAWLNPRSATQFHELQEHQARLLLSRLIDVASHSQPFERVQKELL